MAKKKNEDKKTEENKEEKKTEEAKEEKKSGRVRSKEDIEKIKKEEAIETRMRMKEIMGEQQTNVLNARIRSKYVLRRIRDDKMKRARNIGWVPVPQGLEGLENSQLRNIEWDGSRYRDAGGKTLCYMTKEAAKFYRDAVRKKTESKTKAVSGWSDSVEKELAK